MVSATSWMPSIRTSLLDESLEVAAQQRLAAGQAELLDAVRANARGDALDLLEREQRRALAGTAKSLPKTSRGMQ